ncbi:hypothetical protein KQI76_01210 [Amphibacillus sp. MSJ-3]|uniref:hypothetical protein n=1 Tax=Amphibacillus sp. MSJ-3 TaxID=2841505 RepID=UPI001C0EB621|nr:hypothetical protein [Amphibacillus sp. MSJ-3]MBU5593775.1 hypothetical protein [Amphibacillus sp. MSJ-3]
MDFYYYPGVQLLLSNEANQDVELIYNDNPYPILTTLIGERPPYYFNPRFTESYPIL